ncbi:MAG: sensor domain-containing protein, partial [Actinomycetota bacterium]|nr:sensor domain-containing protein [Actinomycetota bacterium]
PRPVAARRSPSVIPAADPGPSSSGTRWWSKKKLLIGGATVAVAAAGALVAGIIATPPEPPAPALAEDSGVEAVMAAPGMATVQADLAAFKPGGVIELSPPDCLGVLYPGIDEVYQGSQAQTAAWKVLEEPGGLQRAGVNGRPFVDQDIATFAPKSGLAAAFVQQSVPQWRGCVGKTVTVSYPDRNTYTWDIGEAVGDAPRISQTYTLRPGGYTCQRVLDAVADTVIDVKACGAVVTDQASVLTDMIAALVTQAPAF